MSMCYFSKVSKVLPFSFKIFLNLDCLVLGCLYKLVSYEKSVLKIKQTAKNKCFINILKKLKQALQEGAIKDNI